MHLLLAVLLGAVQGVTEFLPVSSSAHIRLLGELLGAGTDPGALFTAVLELGTGATMMVAFAGTLRRVAVAWGGSLVGRVPRADPDARLGWTIVIGNVPIVVLGLLFRSEIDTALRSLWVVAGALIVFGALLGVADRFAPSDRDADSLGPWRSLLLGIAQAAALVPGVSRSGGTITAARLLGLGRASAARTSFLLAVPAVVGSGLLELAAALLEPCSGVCPPAPFTPVETLVAAAVAFVVGLGVVRGLLRYLERGSFLPFVVYRIALGAVLLALLASGVVSAG